MYICSQSLPRALEYSELITKRYNKSSWWILFVRTTSSYYFFSLLAFCLVCFPVAFSSAFQTCFLATEKVLTGSKGMHWYFNSCLVLSARVVILHRYIYTYNLLVCIVQ